MVPRLLRGGVAIPVIIQQIPSVLRSETTEPVPEMGQGSCDKTAGAGICLTFSLTGEEQVCGLLLTAAATLCFPLLVTGGTTDEFLLEEGSICFCSVEGHCKKKHFKGDTVFIS